MHFRVSAFLHLTSAFMHMDITPSLSSAPAFLSLPASVPYSPVACHMPCCYTAAAVPKQSGTDVYKPSCAMFVFFSAENERPRFSLG